MKHFIVIEENEIVWEGPAASPEAALNTAAENCPTIEPGIEISVLEVASETIFRIKGLQYDVVSKSNF
jgi:hypothetical protein